MKQILLDELRTLVRDQAAYTRLLQILETLTNSHDSLRDASPQDISVIGQFSKAFEQCLTQVQNSVDMLDNYSVELGTEGRAQRTAQIRAAVDEMRSILQSLNPATRAQESGLLLEECDLIAMMQEARLEYLARYPYRDIEINLSGIARPVAADGRRMEQMLRHLFAYALDRSGTGDIWVELDFQPQQIRVAVTDQAGEEAASGNVMSLPIIKRIVQLHRGQTVIEQSQGQGCTVTVWLPTRSPL